MKRRRFKRAQHFSCTHTQNEPNECQSHYPAEGRGGRGGRGGREGSAAISARRSVCRWWLFEVLSTGGAMIEQARAAKEGEWKGREGEEMERGGGG